MQQILRFLPDRFTSALVGTVLLATFLPCRGVAAEAVSQLAVVAIGLLFFLHGAKLRRAEVLAGMGHWRLHLLIFLFTFVFFPLLGMLGQWLMPHLFPAPLWIGMIFICALPSTVQSSIAFTSIARGNVPAAICSAAASSLFGIFLTPVLVGVMLQAHGAGISLAKIWDIVLQLLVPFLAGHLLRPIIGDWVDRHRVLLSATDRGSILLVVYSAFSAAVVEGLWHMVPLPTLGLIVVANAVLLGIVLSATRWSARRLGFSRTDEVTIVFCGSKKSLAAGVPMANVLFAGPTLGLIVLPLMIFHQMQLMICAWLARRYAASAPAE